MRNSSDNTLTKLNEMRMSAIAKTFRAIEKLRLPRNVF